MVFISQVYKKCGRYLCSDQNFGGVQIITADISRSASTIFANVETQI